MCFHCRTEYTGVCAKGEEEEEEGREENRDESVRVMNNGAAEKGGNGF